MGKDVLKPSKGRLYILVSVILWIIVEYITVWHSAEFSFAYFAAMLPYMIILNYLPSILILWYALYRREWGEKRVFLVMMILLFFFEFIWGTFFRWGPVWSIPGIFLLISIWGFLTFFPFWMIEGSLRRHKLKVAYYCGWMAFALATSLLFSNAADYFPTLALLALIAGVALAFWKSPAGR